MHQSVVWRIGALIGAVAGLALLSITAAMIIAEATRGNAVAINLAGSLRMQSYRIVSRLLSPPHPLTVQTVVLAEVQEFERRLQHPLLLERTTMVAQQPYQQVQLHWQNRLKPLLVELLNSPQEAPQQHYYAAEVDRFVGQIDALVKALEQDTEGKIRLLRLIQGIALAITLLLIGLLIQQMHSHVILPLRALLHAAYRLRARDFSTRIDQPSEGELGVLGQALNHAAADLAQIYTELEQRVQKQTAALVDGSRALELLYHTAWRLQTNPPNEQTLQQVLDDLSVWLGNGVELRLCGLEPAPVRSLSSGPARAGRVYYLTLDDNERFGELVLYGVDSADSRLPLVETVARHIASALHNQQQQIHERRLGLLEERQAIARELHDSLAQALSYLRIQVALLNQALVQTPNSQAQGILSTLDQGLAAAYRQLRELLTTFRLQLDQPSLEAALQAATAEFAQRGGLQIHLRSLASVPLSPNAEIHVLQIVREALANVVHHAHAQQVWIGLEVEGAAVCLSIADDGLGLPEQPERPQHYGLAIMAERARSLAGQVAMCSRPQGGTVVELRFPLPE